jgi:hypothetical protein
MVNGKVGQKVLYGNIPGTIVTFNEMFNATQKTTLMDRNAVCVRFDTVPVNYRESMPQYRYIKLKQLKRVK